MLMECRLILLEISIVLVRLEYGLFLQPEYYWEKLLCPLHLQTATGEMQIEKLFISPVEIASIEFA
jgi:hypothetical protein